MQDLQLQLLTTTASTMTSSMPTGPHSHNQLHQNSYQPFYEPVTTTVNSHDRSRESDKLKENELNLQTVPTTASLPKEAPETTNEWISAFNTSVLTTRAGYVKDRGAELATLMQSPEFASLLVGAKHLAETQGLSKEEATERLIDTFRKIDFAWKQIVMKRGMQSIIDE